jgi:hypothetical protein
MLKPKSNDISLKRTGIHILSMPAVTAYVSMANDRIYHLSFDPFVLVIRKTLRREKRPIDSRHRLKENVNGVKSEISEEVTR